jgi:hypothetical protein
VGDETLSVGIPIEDSEALPVAIDISAIKPLVSPREGLSLYIQHTTAEVHWCEPYSNHMHDSHY